MQAIWTSILACLAGTGALIAPMAAAQDQSSSDPAGENAVLAAEQVYVTQPQLEEALEFKARQAKEEQAKKDFLGLGLGVGLSLTLDKGDRDRITEVVLDPNGIVRIINEDNDIARVMLEVHHFFQPGIFRDDRDKGLWGWGPFIAIQPGGGEIIDAIAGGLMIGFRYDKESSKSFNLGVGYVVDPNTKVLGDGILPNQPLPDGEVEIRLKETSQHGILVLGSFSF